MHFDPRQKGYPPKYLVSCARWLWSQSYIPNQKNGTKNHHPTNRHPWRIHVCMVYLPTMKGWFLWFSCYGKYTVRPMDHLSTWMADWRMGFHVTGNIQYNRPMDPIDTAQIGAWNTISGAFVLDGKFPKLWGVFPLAAWPGHSMDGIYIYIYLYIWLLFMVNVGKIYHTLSIWVGTSWIILVIWGNGTEQPKERKWKKIAGWLPELKSHLKYRHIIYEYFMIFECGVMLIHYPYHLYACGVFVQQACGFHIFVFLHSGHHPVLWFLFPKSTPVDTGGRKQLASRGGAGWLCRASHWKERRSCSGAAWRSGHEVSGHEVSRCASLERPKLGGGFKYFSCSPLFVEDEPILTNIFQMGWDHQLEKNFK